MSLAVAIRTTIPRAASLLDVLVRGPDSTTLDGAMSPPPDDLPRPIEAGPAELSSADGDGPAELARAIALDLGDAAGLRAIEKLVRAHPRERVLVALRRTQEVAPDRIRRSRAALFTSIVQSLAREAGDHR